MYNIWLKLLQFTFEFTRPIKYSCCRFKKNLKYTILVLKTVLFKGDAILRLVTLQYIIIDLLNLSMSTIIETFGKQNIVWTRR